jgi:hypothetical protein
VARPIARHGQPRHDRRPREISPRPCPIRAQDDQLKVAEKTSLHSGHECHLHRLGVSAPPRPLDSCHPLDRGRRVQAREATAHGLGQDTADSAETIGRRGYRRVPKSGSNHPRRMASSGQPTADRRRFVGLHHEPASSLCRYRPFQYRSPGCNFDAGTSPIGGDHDAL